MPEIKCPWVGCKHNSSNEPGGAGNCKYEGEVELVTLHVNRFSKLSSNLADELEVGMSTLFCKQFVSAKILVRRRSDGKMFLMPDPEYIGSEPHICEDHSDRIMSKPPKSRCRICGKIW